MHTARVRRVGALLVGLSLVAAACGGDDDDDAETTEAPTEQTDAPTEDTEAPMTEAPTSDAPTTDAPTTEAPTSEAPTSEAPTSEPPATGDGELAGMRGTTPKGADVAAWLPGLEEFWVATGNEPLQDFNYAAESYDAVIVTALAVEVAGDDGSAHAAEIVGVTRDGEKCTTYADCLALIQAGTDIDYDGISGPLDFNGNGEPLSGSYAVLEFGPDNRIIESGEEDLRQASLPESAVVDLTPVTVERPGDGVFTVGTLLPETGSLAFLGPPEFAGVEYAISHIDDAGGVLGQPVQYSQGDSGDTSTDTATVTSTRLIGEGVDVIVGAASSGVSLTVIDQITSAGVTMFSPANTAPNLSTYDDKGLYFRDAPSDAMQGAIVAELVIEDGNSSAYILNLDDAYGNGIAAAAQEVLEASGITVLGVKAYDPTATSFDAEVAEIVSADPDAVILVSFDEGSRVLRTAVEQGVGPQAKNYYGTDGNMGNALGENFDAGQ